MPWNIPILLTWLRIVLIPVFAVILYLPTGWLPQAGINWAAALVFAAAGITDWFDGFLARRWGQTSDFGAFLDPVADKLMVAAALILLVQFNRTFALFAIIIIGREITVSALREWMAQMGRRSSVAVVSLGKFKTAAQIAAIIMLLINDRDFYGIDLYVWGNVLMFVAVVLTVWSMLYYLKRAWAQLSPTETTTN
ncbi:CDP-diacylglycerol--glycerol-3-phosphate 3-phosphatidyltransferase [Conchiformibius steedae]|uniref:CDP-diacylglycerol--glycerol-3-phosphate 3-phosphatidyltransferase n=1 Tax=Conchiformibius steedae TaxID=153493 RepID=A0A3P2A1U2_9NEIS|nr:CDP-diacylglycerol--glycerol-3-phosphate 3-phosphatidyltransferase [Conchiformibius steedae]RRD88968.1 CDP-diacylglycerol--glycerol-3-phosphate 3-phosphatidyltransferase [Conchiformibius steedae]